MKKNSLLAALLLIQALVAFFVLTGNRELQDHAGIRKFLEFDRAAMDRIRIEDNEGNVVELRRVDGDWLTSEDFPADTVRVNRLFTSITEMEHGLAVANSTSAAMRFEVSETHFQRHFQMGNGGKVAAEFYLGSGAGARRSYVRLADQGAIYAATIGSYDLPVTMAEWQNKELLRIEVDAIERVETDNLIVRKEAQDDNDTDDSENVRESKWILEGLNAGEIFKIDNFKEQLRKLAGLRYDRAFKGSVDDLQVAAEFTVNYNDSRRTYWFYRMEADNNFWLKVSDRDELFEVSAYVINPMINSLTRQTLVEIPETEAAAGSREAPDVETKSAVNSSDPGPDDGK